MAEERNGTENQRQGFPFGSKNFDEDNTEGMKLWGIFIFGVIGVTATVYAVGQGRRNFEWLNMQMNRGMHWRQSSKQGGSNSSQQSHRSREDAWSRYNQRMQEELEEEMERVERIRRMQSVFNRERERYKRSYEKWYENDSDAYQQQNFQRNDWYWKTDRSQSERAESARRARMRAHGNYALAHHYEVLGLDMFRVEPYSEAEIKGAFRSKAKEYHPDQNPNNKEAAEEKFKQVMVSYEALKEETKTK